jgi:hypothetical protein
MGPSKEELAKYFKNNRKYFDELANHYKQYDPAYYNQFIAPFYSNPFAFSGRKGRRPAIAILAAMLSISISAAVIFFTVRQSSHVKVYDGNEVEESINADEIESIKNEQIKILDTLSSIKELGNYEKGIMYYNLGDYKRAEKFLLNVPENNVLYKDAQEKLKEINKKGVKK